MDAVETLSPVDTRRRSRLGRLRAGLLASALFVLSMTLVVTTPTTAQAWASPPTPVQIAGAMKSPPARLISWTPQGRLVVLAIGLGMLAYQTKDSWWPTVEGWIHPPPEAALHLGQYKLYDLGDQSPVIRCEGSSPVLAKVPDTSGQTIGWNGLRLGFNASCVGPKHYPNWEFPSFSIYAVSLCRNVSTNALAYRAKLEGVPSEGSLGTRVDNASPTGKSKQVIIQWTAALLCNNASNEVPVKSWFGLNGPTNTLSTFPIKELDGVNTGSPEPADWGQTTSVRCRKPDGTYQTISDVLYGDDKKLGMPSCAARVPGSIPWDGTVTHGPRNGPQTTIGTFATDEGLFEEWRDCFGPTGVTCRTEVYIDGERCTIGRAVCVNWTHIWRGEPERVQCRFGTHIVPVSDCQPLRRAYGDRTITITTPELAEEVDTSVDIETEPLAPPGTQPQPDPSTPPNPNPSAPPTTGPNPETPTAPPTNPESNPDSRSCYGDAWSWNPIDWVYVPVKCALKWAFVPKTSVQVRTQRIGTAYDLKFPFTVPAMVGGLGGNVGGGCPDWNVIVGADTWDAVCDSTFTQAIRGARGWLTGGMLAAAFWPLVRGLFFASVPVIKPTPTEGK